MLLTETAAQYPPASSSPVTLHFRFFVGYRECIYAQVFLLAARCRTWKSRSQSRSQRIMVSQPILLTNWLRDSGHINFLMSPQNPNLCIIIWADRLCPCPAKWSPTEWSLDLLWCLGWDQCFLANSAKNRRETQTKVACIVFSIFGRWRRPIV